MLTAFTLTTLFLFTIQVLGLPILIPRDYVDVKITTRALCKDSEDRFLGARAVDYSTKLPPIFMSQGLGGRWDTINSSPVILQVQSTEEKIPDSAWFRGVPVPHSLSPARGKVVILVRRKSIFTKIREGLQVSGCRFSRSISSSPEYRNENQRWASEGSRLGQGYGRKGRQVRAQGRCHGGECGRPCGFHSTSRHRKGHQNSVERCFRSRKCNFESYSC